MDEQPKKQFREIKIIFFLILTVILTLSFLSYDPNDIGIYTSSPNDPTNNFAGIIGAYLGFFSFFLFGLGSLSIPFILTYWIIRLIFNSSIKLIHIVMLILFIFTVSSLLEILNLSFLNQYTHKLNIISAGGLIPFKTTRLILLKYLGEQGSLGIICLLLVFSFLKAADIHFFKILIAIGKSIKQLFKAKEVIEDFEDEFQSYVKTPLIAKAEKKTIDKQEKEKEKEKEQEQEQEKEQKLKKKIRTTPLPPKGSSTYKLPGLNLLEDPPKQKDNSVENINLKSQVLEDTLRQFGIESKVVDVVKGPVITRFELKIAPGIKVNKITSLSDDIAMCMKAISVRIIAPIPGKDAIGIEIPNKKGTLVYLKELLQAKNYEDALIPLIFGKDITGEPMIEDLAELPHLLIAGSTGSGKTVCINSLIMGLLFNKRPDELKLLMIDPKRVELTQYRKIPHLMCPIIVEAKKAVIALNMLVKEMEDRYKLFAKAGVRNILKYNSRNLKNDPKDDDEELPQTVPYIVVVIDELADLMMTSSSDIEVSITRLAQLSRAVGIHLILATQRPSVNVLTGIIKANFPARLSFKVSSRVDSRTILDGMGAEKLIGKGDMLYIPPKTSKLIRAQGTLVSDSDINRIVEFLSAQGEPEFNSMFARLADETQMELGLNGVEAQEDEDELYEQAIEFILEVGQASASMLQRKFRIGYNRASRMIDQMENQNIVGPFNGSRVREVLINKKKSDQYDD